jgi:hypothetical protein
MKRTVGAFSDDGVLWQQGGGVSIPLLAACWIPLEEAPASDLRGPEDAEALTIENVMQALQEMALSNGELSLRIYQHKQGELNLAEALRRYLTNRLHQPEPVSPLPAAGDFLWHPEMGLAMVAVIGQRDFRMERADGTLCCIQGADSTWNDWVPVTVCCPEGHFYFREGHWWDARSNTYAAPGHFSSHCNRVLGVDSNGLDPQPTVSGRLFDGDKFLEMVRCWQLAFGASRMTLVGVYDRLAETFNALAAEPLSEA